MATALQICNSALIKLGAKTITALTGGLTKEFDMVTAQYPRLRNALLRSHPWAFAKVVSDTLTQVAADVMTETWAYKITLPTDIGRVLAISDTNNCEISYELLGGYFYTNEPSPRLRYIKRYIALDDATDFPEDFSEALANLLAADICVAFTQNQSLRDTYLQAYSFAIGQARFNGAIENTYYPASTANDWLDAHSGIDYPGDPSRRPLNIEEALLLES